jgi:hypothetical protein
MRCVGDACKVLLNSTLQLFCGISNRPLTPRFTPARASFMKGSVAAGRVQAIVRLQLLRLSSCGHHASDEQSNLTETKHGYIVAVKFDM